MTVLALIGYLATHGCQLACAAGIIANLEAEAGPRLNPCVVGRSGIGLAQWAGTRRQRLLATYGQAWCNPGHQIEFIVTELRELGLIERLLRATDPALAARIFMLEFEKPRHRNPAHRMQRAREIYRGLEGAR